jgi:hypothetical protein
MAPAHTSLLTTRIVSAYTECRMAPPRGWRWLLCVVVVALAAALLADGSVCCRHRHRARTLQRQRDRGRTAARQPLDRERRARRHRHRLRAREPAHLEVRPRRARAALLALQRLLRHGREPVDRRRVRHPAERELRAAVLVERHVHPPVRRPGKRRREPPPAARHRGRSDHRQRVRSTPPSAASVFSGTGTYLRGFGQLGSGRATSAGS